MDDPFFALDLLRIANNYHFAREETVEEVKEAGEGFARVLTLGASEVDPRIQIPPIRWRVITDGKDEWAYRGAIHDRKEWLEQVRDTLRDAVFLTGDIPPGWLGPLPPLPIRTTAVFVEWLRNEVPYVQGFLSSPNLEHPEWQLTIAQHSIHNANTWMAHHLNREIPPTPDTVVECARQLVNLLVTLTKSEVREPVTENRDGTRRKRTKDETTKRVHAAIAFKIQNPTWSESKCAEEAELPGSTLNGHPLWQEWRQKIDAAQSRGNLSAVRHEYDRRTKEFLAIDEPESDISE